MFDVHERTSQAGFLWFKTTMIKKIKMYTETILVAGN